MDYSEYKKTQALSKKENPIAWKFKHIREILGYIQISICNKMNCCGWQYAPGTYYEELDYWYRWEHENYNHTQSYAFKNFSKNDMRKITGDVRKTALVYFKKAYELYKKGYRLTYGGNEKMFCLNCKWFEKNIKKLEANN